MKRALAKIHITADDDIRWAVEDFLDSHENDYETRQKFLHQWQKHVSLEGDYYEK